MNNRDRHVFLASHANPLYDHATTPTAVENTWRLDSSSKTPNLNIRRPQALLRKRSPRTRVVGDRPSRALPVGVKRDMICESECAGGSRSKPRLSYPARRNNDNNPTRLFQRRTGSRASLSS